MSGGPEGKVRRLEDHLPDAALQPLQEDAIATGWPVRDLVLLAIANHLLARAMAIGSRTRLEQAHALMALLLEDAPARRVDDKGRQ